MKWNFKKDLLLLLFVAIIIFSLTYYFSRTLEDDNDYITLGTFNIEWLGDGINDRNPRTENDYQMIAQVISDLDADILGLQEIENHTALSKVMKYLPQYSYFVGELGSQQNLAIIYKNELIIKDIAEYTPLILGEDKQRPGLIAEVKKGNFDFIFKVVHFKSTSRYDDTDEKRERTFDLRLNQSQIISNWADSILQIGKELDLIIVGDFNCNPNKTKNATLTPIIENNELIFITDHLTSCKYPQWETIDHILVSSSALNRKIKRTLYQHDIFSQYTDEQIKLISDHCPIIVQFEILTPDND